MLNSRLTAIADVTRDLDPAEKAVDEAFSHLAKLLNTMCSVRASAHLPIRTAQAEFDHISAALALTGQARSHILAAHEKFVTTRSEVTPTISWGDDGCPPGGGTSTSEDKSPVRLVG
jgi:hypothetical protein